MLNCDHLGVEQGHGCPVDKAQGEDIFCGQHQSIHQVLLDFSDGREESSLITSMDECHKTVLGGWVKQTVCSCYALDCPPDVVLDLCVIALCFTVLHHLRPRHKLLHIMRHPQLQEFELVFRVQ